MGIIADGRVVCQIGWVVGDRVDRGGKEMVECKGEESQSGGMADAGDLKSPTEFSVCGFESRLWHQKVVYENYRGAFYPERLLKSEEGFVVLLSEFV